LVFAIACRALNASVSSVRPLPFAPKSTGLRKTAPLSGRTDDLRHRARCVLQRFIANIARMTSFEATCEFPYKNSALLRIFHQSSILLIRLQNPQNTDSHAIISRVKAPVPALLNKTAPYVQPTYMGVHIENMQPRASNEPIWPV
jgi:hypothetical protein